MEQIIKCPECGTKNPAKEKFCSTCKSELLDLRATTATLTQISEKINTGPEIDVGTLNAGEKAVFVVKKGPILGQRLPVKKDETIIGRDPKADIFLNDITVSRRHAKVSIEGEQAKVKDMGSLNGTYLNNTRFSESILKNTDELQIGKFILVYLCR